MGSSQIPGSSSANWDAEAVKEWVVANARTLMIGGAALVVIVAAVLFWQQSVRLKGERADMALATAQSAYYSGNVALAKSDLEKLVSRYPGTAGATQAAMLLAQIMYGESNYEGGIAQLTSALRGAPEAFQAAIEELIAAGYADSGKPTEAAAHYLKAAAAARFPAERDLYRGDAARQYAAAGNADEARKIWSELAEKLDSPMFNEARVRMGELTAKAAAP